MIPIKFKASIIISTLCRGSLYPLLAKLVTQESGIDFELILVPQYQLNKRFIPDNDRIKIFSEKPGKGFSFYRNYGVLKSTGNIIIFIDDDELPVNRSWLSEILSPILSGSESVTTSGYRIKLNQGYFTDSVSLLGFPGGGAVGFEVMWKVDEYNYTKHICTGNMAIKKELLNKIGGFNEKLVYGHEDVSLSDILVNKGYCIRYVSSATVYHIARRGYLNFIKWNVLRGKSAYFYKKVRGDITSNLTNRFSSSIKILRMASKTRYLPGVIFCMVNQYLWQTVGYFIEEFKNPRFPKK